MPSKPPTPYGATYDPDTDAIQIIDLRLNDEVIAAEARRWTTGARGPEVTDPMTLAGADLTEFVTQSMRLGAFAIAATGAEQDRFGVERLVKEVGERTSRSAADATALTKRAVEEAASAVTKAADEAKTSFAKADHEQRRHFATTVESARTAVTDEIKRVLGGDNPELVERLRPVIDKFAADLEMKAHKQTDELFRKAVKQLDPSDPTSPMAKHTTKLAEEQRQLSESFTKSHAEVAAKLETLAKDVAAQNAAKEAHAKLASVSPIKGGDYESDMNQIMGSIAADLGDEYASTGKVAGIFASRCYKGDGVLTVAGGTARVVLEMTDSPDREKKGTWNEYLDIAERNREAAASLGLVKSSEQNAGRTVRSLGPRRIVLAFDPAHDDPELLRTVVILLRFASIAASGRHGDSEIKTAQENLDMAIEELQRLDGVKKVAGSIKKGAERIDEQCSGISTSIQRLLTEAMTALDGVPSVDEPAATNGAA